MPRGTGVPPVRLGGAGIGQWRRTNRTFLPRITPGQGSILLSAIRGFIRVDPCNPWLISRRFFCHGFHPPSAVQLQRTGGFHGLRKAFLTANQAKYAKMAERRPPGTARRENRSLFQAATTEPVSEPLISRISRRRRSSASRLKWPRFSRFSMLFDVFRSALGRPAFLILHFSF